MTKRLSIASQIPEVDRALAWKISRDLDLGDPDIKTLSALELERAYQSVSRFDASEIKSLSRLAKLLGVAEPRHLGPDIAASVLGAPRTDKQGKILRRTRVVCTIGPASSDVATLAKMIECGMDVARLNFSHIRDHASAQGLVDNLDAAMRKAGHKIEILADLQGPKIRVDALPQPFTVIKGDRVELCNNGGTAPGQIPIAPPEILGDIKKGNRVFINDGNVALVVTDIKDGKVEARVIRGGKVASRKGFNLPDTPIKAHIPTQRDLKSIDIINRLQIDGEPAVHLVAASFVESGDDVNAVRRAFGRDMHVISKVERQVALDESNLNSIFAQSDGIMVARGDLGVEIGLHEVPVQQNRIHRKGNRGGVITGTATQMMESMTAGGPPTRAECNDVADAILDGGEFVMTSGETAMGKDPIRVVKAIVDVIDATERAMRTGTVPSRPQF